MLLRNICELELELDVPTGELRAQGSDVAGVHAADPADADESEGDMVHRKSVIHEALPLCGRNMGTFQHFV
jgi:hypothetical protein